jgi:hypothetical protein
MSTDLPSKPFKPEIQDLHGKAAEHVTGLNPLQLMQEYRSLMQPAGAAMKQDIQDCRDARDGDVSGIRDITDLLKGKPGAAAKVAAGLTGPDGDIAGDIKAGGNGAMPTIDPKNPLKQVDGEGKDQQNAKRDALIVETERRILMEGLNGHKLNAQQVLALKQDMKAKEGDLRNSLSDIPLEGRYQKDDQRLLAALQNPSNREELTAAARAVIADRQLDITNETGHPGRARNGGGYVGQDQRSITATDRILRNFQISGK